MEKELLEEIYTLKSLLDKNPLILDLKEKNTELNNSPEIYKLSKKMHDIETIYNDLAKIYDENNDLLVSERKKLYEVKKELDLNPKVQEYYKAYKKVKELYMEINDALFSEFYKL